MATVIEETLIEAPPEAVWAALADFGAVADRLAPGFLTYCRLDGDDTRIVTFFNGAVARERLVGIDDDARRLAYSVIESPLGSTHHNASAQVLADDSGGTRFVWITDVLPDQLADSIREMMHRGIGVMKTTLEGMQNGASQAACGGVPGAGFEPARSRRSRGV